MTTASASAEAVPFGLLSSASGGDAVCTGAPNRRVTLVIERVTTIEVTAEVVQYPADEGAANVMAGYWPPFFRICSA
jgi:hypothetical protein